MGPEDESKSTAESPESSADNTASSQAARRGRRSGRGRRGRGRRHSRPRGAPPGPGVESEAQPETGEAQITPPEDIAEPPPPPAREEERDEAPPPPRERHQPASPATIQKAIDEVNQIISTLRETLDDMDEVLETLELAERQKDADEHEIESLRRSLRQLHRPRDGGNPHR